MIGMVRSRPSTLNLIVVTGAPKEVPAGVAVPGLSVLCAPVVVSLGNPAMMSWSPA
jgi:hypothetical protein